MKLTFYKMTGLGNDYVYLDFLNQKEKIDYKSFSQYVSNRNFAVGSDGLVVILPSKKADVQMRIFNSDGSEAEICGNALRCISKLIFDKYKIKELSVETKKKIVKTKIISSTKQNALVSVEMGKVDSLGKAKINIENKIFTLNILDVGNPHCVVFVDSFNFDIEKIGKTISHFDIFKNDTNVEFVKIVDDNNLQVKVYERGSGVTLACGSGACASAICYLENHQTESKQVSVLLDGGSLFICGDDKNNVLMTGLATYVFKGEIDYSPELTIEKV